MADQPRRRNSWPWRKLKLGSSTSKAGDKSSHFSPSELASPGSSFKAEESARFIENSWKQEASRSTAIEDGRIGEAIALREKAEESLRALKQELNTLVKELTAKEALVKQHQKVADEAVSGWEKAEKEVLSLKQELEAASKRKAILEDRITQLDGALKECMKQVRHVRDEQEAKIREAIGCKTREWAEVKADMDAKQAELQRRLMESDAQNSAMIRNLQERARKILEANEAKSKTDGELKVMQVKLASAEKDISSLQYELHLLSKELEIRNEEVAYCKKSADAAHKQHLDNVQKVAKLEADCLRLRILVKKKLPGPAAIAQMRKEVEGLPIKEITTTSATAPELKRRPSRSYASSTISFTNSHQRSGIGSNINRDVEMLQDRLVSVEEENKLLKEALSKRINDLQSSWLLCAKTANKLCIAEDHLESLQGTPRDHARTDRSFDFAFTTTGTPSIASVSDVETVFGGHDDVEEASCAESWASALIGELAHFKREKIITKEAIKEVTESYTTKGSSSSANVVHEVPHEEKCPVVNDTLPEVDQKLAPSEMGDVLQQQHEQVKAMSLLCKDLDHKLGKIEEALRAGNGSAIDKLIGLVDAAFSELEKKIQGLKSSPIKSVAPEHGLLRNTAAITIRNSEVDESGLDVGMRMPTIESTAAMQESDESGAPMLHVATLKCQEGESKMDACRAALGPDVYVKHCDANQEEKHELDFSSSLGSLLSKLITLLEILPRRAGDATLDADCAGWDREKQGLGACKDRFLQGQASVLEILARVGMLVCRACHVGSQELEHMLASFINADMAAQQVSINAAGLLTPLPGQLPGAYKADELDVVGKRDADMATGGANKADELATVPPPDELDANVAAGGATTLEDSDEVDADVAGGHNNPGELAGHVACTQELDAGLLTSKLAQMQSEKERLSQERNKLCEEGATKTAELQEAQAQLSHYKVLHSQLQIKNEELQMTMQQTKNEEVQMKMQGLDVEDDDCNAVKLLNIGEGMNQTKESGSDLVEAKEKLAECERTMMDLGKQLHALSSTSNNAQSLPHHHRYVHATVDEPSQLSRQRGWPSSCHVVSGPQGSTSSPQRAVPVKARHQRYGGAADWLQQLDDQEYGQYSPPPLSAMSSPSRSPGRYIAQQVSGRARGSGVRTSLTESLNVAAANKCSASKARPPATSSSFGRLFSRSRNGPG